MWLRNNLPPIRWWPSLECISVCANDITKCVATAVTRKSGTCGSSRNTIWNISTSLASKGRLARIVRDHSGRKRPPRSGGSLGSGAFNSEKGFHDFQAELRHATRSSQPAAQARNEEKRRQREEGCAERIT